MYCCQDYHRLVCVIYCDHRVLAVLRFVKHDTNVLLQALDHMIRKLTSSIIVDNGVGNLRPAVPQVPPQNARSSAFPDAKPLNKKLQSFRLRKLGQRR